MLRRVVVQNFLVFKGRHELDLGGKDGCNFYSFVGENASGKSGLIDLIKSAGNFSTSEQHFDEISSDGKDAKIVCKFEFANGRELTQYCEECKSSKFYPHNTRVAGLNSWFADDILKIPVNLAKPIAEVCTGVKTKVQIFIGYRYQAKPQDEGTVPSESLESEVEGETRPVVETQFLYVMCNEFSFVAVKFFGILRTRLHDALPGGIDPVDWIPGESSLRDIKMQSLYSDGGLEPASPVVCGDPFYYASMDSNESQTPASKFQRFSTMSYYQQKIQTLCSLLKNFPKGSLGEIQPLFNEIVGNKSIIFQEKYDGDMLHVIDTKINRAVERIPEGHYSAFVVAALLVKPFTKTVLLDEPTRGMHPLQIRRLRSILMRESMNRRKCIIAVTHSPEMVDVERITLICRFQMLPSGYCHIRRVTSRYSARDLHFIGGSEVRELFFTKNVVWVEGESDRRFIEALLKFFDGGRRELWEVLLADGTIGMSTGEESHVAEDGKPITSHRIRSAVENLLLDPVYKRHHFSAEELSVAQEACRSCSILPMGGKKNMGKGSAICRDLGIPYAVICDLDALVPNSKENSISQQFENCKGDWSAARISNPKYNLVDEEACPAYRCIEEGDHAQVVKLKSCRTIRQVMQYYESEQNIFSWRVNNGEIEDAVRMTKSQFGKKLWGESSGQSLETLLLQLIQPKRLLHLNPKDKDGHTQPNREILRCIYFLIKFFKNNLEG